MLPRIWVVNVILSILVLLLAVTTYDFWNEAGKSVPDPAGAQMAPPKKHIIFVNKLPPESAYKAIPEDNLFSPERAEILPPPPKKVEDTQEIKKNLQISGKNITLYGVVIVGAYKKALITNPMSGIGEPKDKWVKEGDILGDLKVNGIKKDRVLLRESGKKYQVLLYDKKRPKNREMIQKDEKPRVVATEPVKAQTKTPPKTREAPPEKKPKVSKTPFG